MFDDLKFQIPETAVAAFNKQPALPNWMKEWKQIVREKSLSLVSQRIKKLESSSKFKRGYRRIFGMVKLLDDNIGKLLKVLEDFELDENTIVVFSSDHGDMMGEHGANNKGAPYKTSAGVPFLIRWPKKIPKGTVVESAYSSVDFAPTLLNMLGVDTGKLGFQGIDGSKDILGEGSRIIADGNQIRFLTGDDGRWAAAVNQRYKLVLAPREIPWLFDTDVDPDELLNFYNQEGYEDVSATMKEALYAAMMQYDFGLWSKSPVLLDRPACEETADQLDKPRRFKTCKDLIENAKSCEWKQTQELCPVSCGTCVQDSTGQFLFEKKLMSCQNKVRSFPTWLCKDVTFRNFCGKTCLGRVRRRGLITDANSDDNADTGRAITVDVDK